MAPAKVAADFNAIINADRQRRKNEALAQEIFGKGRKSSAPGVGLNSRKPGTGPSLASRVGVAKRSVSTTQKNTRSNGKPAAAGNVEAEWTHDLHALNNPSASRVSQQPNRTSRSSRANRNERIYSALNGSASSPVLNSQFNVVAPKPSAGMTIKGLAGPYIVMAKNFALGTTAADIESAMTPVGGVCLSCRLITERPNVIAEVIFESKEGADNVVATFNNQNADGNLLHVYHKLGASKLLNAQSALVSSGSLPHTPLGPRADTIADRSDDARSGYDGSDRYTPRNRSRERRRDYDSRDEVMDGSYGFDDRMDTDNRDDNYEKGRGRGGLYSDDLVSSSRGRGLGNSRDKVRGYR